MTITIIWLAILLAIADHVISLPVSTKTGEHCTKGAVDLVFVVDESLSIDNDDFQRTITFLANVVNSMDIGPAKGQSQVGLVKFSASAILAFGLNDYNTTQQVYKRILATNQVTGGTNIAEGMNKASSVAFTSQGGDRRDVPNMMLVLTDGQDSSDVIGAHKAAAAKNITVAVIGIGNAVSSTQLQAIVGGNLVNVHNVTNFKGLDNLTKEICLVPSLESAGGFPWMAVLPALLIIPLAFIICAALFIRPLRRWRQTKEQISAVEMQPLTNAVTEHVNPVVTSDICSKPVTSMSSNRSPKPPPANRKWKTSVEQINASAVIQTETLENGTAHPPKVPPKKPDGRSSTKKSTPIVPEVQLLPPRKPNRNINEDDVGAFESDKSQNAENVHIPKSEIDSRPKLAEKKQPLLPKIPPKKPDGRSNTKNSTPIVPEAKPVPPRKPNRNINGDGIGAFESDKSQNAENFHIPESEIDSRPKLAEKKQLLLPKNPKKTAVDVRSNDTVEYSQLQKDKSKIAEKICNQTSNVNPHSRTPSAIWGGIASGVTVPSKMAEVIRRNETIASENEMGRESGIGYGQTDAPRTAELIHVGGGGDVKQKTALFARSKR